MDIYKIIGKDDSNQFLKKKIDVPYTEIRVHTSLDLLAKKKRSAQVDILVSVSLL